MYMFTLYFGVRRNLNKTYVVHRRIKVTAPRKPMWETIVCTPPPLLNVGGDHTRLSLNEIVTPLSRFTVGWSIIQKTWLTFLVSYCKIISSGTIWKVFYFDTNGTNRFNLQILTLLYMYDIYQNTLSTKTISV